MPLPKEVDGLKKPFVQLCPDITRTHAAAIAEWLRHADVHRYLSDSPQTASDLSRLLDRVALSTLTHLFNQNGRFLMVCDNRDRPVGFVRLVYGQNGDLELVVVIGAQAGWGRHYGRQAVRECLRIAFFDMRAERVVARIHHDNERSRRIFSHLGFCIETSDSDCVCMTMNMDAYLRLTSAMPAHSREILLSQCDRERLLRWLDQVQDSDRMALLAGEISRAVIVDSRELPDDVITMNSRATLSIEDKDLTVALAYPDAADSSRRSVSVLSPIGTAIIGFRTGDRFNWRFPHGLANITVRGLLYQPEAAGHYHL